MHTAIIKENTVVSDKITCIQFNVLSINVYMLTVNKILKRIFNIIRNF